MSNGLMFWQGKCQDIQTLGWLLLIALIQVHSKWEQVGENKFGCTDKVCAKVAGTTRDHYINEVHYVLYWNNRKDMLRGRPQSSSMESQIYLKGGNLTENVSKGYMLPWHHCLWTFFLRVNLESTKRLLLLWSRGLRLHFSKTNMHFFFYFHVFN